MTDLEFCPVEWRALEEAEAETVTNNPTTTRAAHGMTVVDARPKPCSFRHRAGAELEKHTTSLQETQRRTSSRLIKQVKIIRGPDTTPAETIPARHETKPNQGKFPRTSIPKQQRRFLIPEPAANYTARWRGELRARSKPAQKERERGARDPEPSAGPVPNSRGAT